MLLLKKILYFGKILLFQNLIFYISFCIIRTLKLYDKLYKNIFEFMYDCRYGFFYSFGIAGLLLIATSLTIVYQKNNIKALLLNLLWIYLYVFVFFAKVLDISNIYKELLIPSLLGVLIGTLPFMILRKRKNK